MKHKNITKGFLSIFLVILLFFSTVTYAYAEDIEVVQDITKEEYFQRLEQPDALQEQDKMQYNEPDIEDNEIDRRDQDKIDYFNNVDQPEISLEEKEDYLAIDSTSKVELENNPLQNLQPTLPEHKELNTQGSYQTSLFTGSATYTYDIKLPPATNNLQPTLKIRYNSQSRKDELIGTGWSITQSYIQRDTFYTPDDPSDDRFKLVLNGEEFNLVYNPQDNRYHTEIESYLYIKKVQGGNNENGEYWIVKTKDGITYRLGYNIVSEILSNQFDYVWRWSLDLVTDTNENKVYYSYMELTNDGILYLNRIDYNNDRSRIIEFVYENKPNTKTIFKDGQKIQISKRLSEIKVTADNNLVHKYTFSYSINDEDTLSFLKEITIFGSDGISKLPPVTFYYNYEHDVQPNINRKWEVPVYFGENTVDTGARLVDVNGDGLVDIIRSKCDYSLEYCYSNPQRITKEVWINTGEEWLSDEDWIIPDIPFTVGSSRDSGTMLADINGDGLTDIVTLYNNPGLPSFTLQAIWINTGEEFIDKSEIWTFPEDEYLHVGYVNGGYDTGLRLADVNGDGLMDLVKSYCNYWLEACYNDPSLLTRKVWINNGNGWIEDDDWILPNVNFNINKIDPGTRLADVNGDGLVDVIVMYDDGSGSSPRFKLQKLWLNTGSGWVEDNDWIFPDAYFIIGNHFPGSGPFNLITGLVDINGDGLLDLVKSHCEVFWADDCNRNPERISKKIWINNGKGWVENNDWMLPDIPMRARGRDPGTRIADINGDGLIDFIQRFVDNIFGDNEELKSNVWINNAVQQNLLRKIVNNHGGSTTIDYKKSTVFDNENLNFNIWVVDKITEDNGITGPQHIVSMYEYDYSGGMFDYDYEDQEFRGFNIVQETKPDNTLTTYKFHQDDAKKGKLYEERISEIQNEDRILFEKREYVWEVSEEKPYIVNLEREATSTYDDQQTPKKRVVNYKYDQFGNILKKTDVGDIDEDGDETYEEFEYALNENKWIIGKIKHSLLYDAANSNRQEVYYSYDGQEYGEAPYRGKITRKEVIIDGSQNPMTQYTYDRYGNIIRETDPNGHITLLFHDPATHTYPIRSINPKGHETTYIYNLGTGNIISETDPNGYTISYKYDTFGRITKEIYEYDSERYPTVEYIYLYDGNSPESIFVKQREIHLDPATINTFYFYDGFGRLIQSRRESESNNLIQTDYSYDDNGRVKQVSNPYYIPYSEDYRTPIENNGFQYAYDALNRITKVTNPDNTEKSIKYNKWTVTIIDENNNRKDYALDAYGQIVTVTEHNNGESYVTRYKYDVLGNIIEINDAQGNMILYTYDNLGRKLTEQYPDINLWRFKYDPAGNLVEQTDGRGIVSGFAYDALNRLIQAKTLTETIIYVYDQDTIGTLSSVRDATGITEFQYDRRLRKIEEKRNMDGQRFAIRTAYNALNKITSESINENPVIYIY